MWALRRTKPKRKPVERRRLGWCSRCGIEWDQVEPRVVDYRPGRGHFALCEECWDRTTLDERVFYYVWSFAQSAAGTSLTTDTYEPYLGELEDGSDKWDVLTMIDGVRAASEGSEASTS